MSKSNVVITCKAAVAWAPGEALVMEQVDVQPPKRNEVRIKITHTSLCHTDLTFWKSQEMQPLFPRIFGHEAAGIVESVGDGVRDLVAGDHVIPIFTGECTECSLCTSGKTNLCMLLPVDPAKPVLHTDGTSRFSCSRTGATISHFMGTSTFSEYTVVHEGCVVKVPPEAPLDKACLFSCGITTGLGAVWNSAKVQPGDTVAIFGLGTIGLAIAEGARISGASRIIGIDVNPAKNELGKKFGVTDFVNPKDHDKPVQEIITEIVPGGVDYSFECIGSPKLMQAAMESSHSAWGTTVIVGVPSSKDPVSSNPLGFLFGQVLKGTIFGGYKKSKVPELLEKYLRNEIKVDGFITHELPFDRINDAFELLMQGDCLRCVLHMN